MMCAQAKTLEGKNDIVNMLFIGSYMLHKYEEWQSLIQLPLILQQE